MAVNWTREQKQVIEGREKSLLVSAAAGSGKTAVLVERIIRMITEGGEPEGHRPPACHDFYPGGGGGDAGADPGGD